MCCLGFISKYVLFFFNLACTVGSVAVMVLGIMAMTNFGILMELVPVNLDQIAIFVVFFGCVAFLISFLGCWGAFTENRLMLVLYCVTMLVLAGLKTWLAVMLLIKTEGLKDSVPPLITKSFDHLNQSTHLTAAFHVMESSFKCCGTTGASSYLNKNNGEVDLKFKSVEQTTFDTDDGVSDTRNNEDESDADTDDDTRKNDEESDADTVDHHNNNENSDADINIRKKRENQNERTTIPGSCCGKDVKETCSEDNAFKGCNKEIPNYLIHHDTVLGVIVLGFIAVEMVAVILGLCLNDSISQKNSRIKLSTFT